MVKASAAERARFGQAVLRMAGAASAGTYVCECCGLPYPIKKPISSDVESRLHQVNRVPTRCGRCSTHRDADVNLDTWVRRAEKHAQWYWDLYQKEVATVRRMKAEVQEAEVRVSGLREKTVLAYRSRDHSVRLLAKIADLHQPERRGGCSCGKRPDCATAKITDTGWVVDRIRDLERRGAMDDMYADLDDWSAG